MTWKTTPGNRSRTLGRFLGRNKERHRGWGHARSPADEDDALAVLEPCRFGLFDLVDVREYPNVDARTFLLEDFLLDGADDQCEIRATS